MKTNKVVFQLTEEQIRQWVWTAKNYGQDETTDVTPQELKDAKSLVQDHVLSYLEELVSDSVVNK